MLPRCLCRPSTLETRLAMATELLEEFDYVARKSCILRVHVPGTGTAHSYGWPRRRAGCGSGMPSVGCIAGTRQGYQVDVSRRRGCHHGGATRGHSHQGSSEPKREPYKMQPCRRNNLSVSPITLCQRSMARPRRLPLERQAVPQGLYLAQG